MIKLFMLKVLIFLLCLFSVNTSLVTGDDLNLDFDYTESQFNLFQTTPSEFNHSIDDDFNQYNNDFEDLLVTEQPEKQREKADKLSGKTDELKRKLKQRCATEKTECFAYLNQTNIEVNQSLDCYDQIKNKCAEHLALDNIQHFVERISQDGISNLYEDSQTMNNEIDALGKTAGKFLNSHFGKSLWDSYQKDQDNLTLKNATNFAAIQWSETLYNVSQKAKKTINHHKTEALNQKKYIHLSLFLKCNVLQSKCDMFKEVAQAIEHVTSDKPTDKLTGLAFAAIPATGKPTNKLTGKPTKKLTGKPTNTGEPTNKTTNKVTDRPTGEPTGKTPSTKSKNPVWVIVGVVILVVIVLSIIFFFLLGGKGIKSSTVVNSNHKNQIKQ